MGGIPAVPAVASSATRPAVVGQSCPECGTAPERVEQVFCEVCGYNFRTGASGVPVFRQEAPAAPATPAPPAPPAAPPPLPTVTSPPSVTPATTAGEAADHRWDVVVTVDACLYGKPAPNAPVDQPAQTFTLFETENLIGRAGTEVRVHIPIGNDHGVSRRQAMLVRLPDHRLVVRDLGSANGTQVNGRDILPGVDTPLRDGDWLSIGAWTRIAVKAGKS